RRSRSAGGLRGPLPALLRAARARLIDAHLLLAPQKIAEKKASNQFSEIAVEKPVEIPAETARKPRDGAGHVRFALAPVRTSNPLSHQRFTRLPEERPGRTTVECGAFNFFPHRQALLPQHLTTR